MSHLGDVLVAIHRLLRGKHERLRPHLGFNCERPLFPKK
jgi:hypothetical protein